MSKMGSATAPRQPTDAAGDLVAFDFDGTLTVQDSFNAFLYWRAGPLGALIGRLRLLPEALLFFLHRDRARLKAAMVRYFLAGVALEAVETDAARYAKACSATLLRPDALACWNDWRSRGARLLIITASPDFVVAPFAKALGATRLIATRLQLDAQGRFTGALDGPNCRNAEKIVRLKAEFGADVRLVAAYGDSDGDVEMLAFAEGGGMKLFRQKP